jgi:cellulose synthase/poly-beta-1,6-N-acetylglucosamine synthase-like glycosyltransferase
LYDQVAARGQCFDAVVVIDADTTIAPDFLWAMHESLRSGATVAQAFYSVRDPDTSPVTSLRFAALACRHHLRSLGRRRIGASCGLHGNGMVFTRRVYERRRWSGHLVEDAEMQIELLLEGHHVTYVPGAALWAEMPADRDQSRSQQQRWERGRIEVAQRFVPTLLRRAWRSKGQRVRFADAAVDQLVPPLSVVLLFELVAIALASGATVLKVRRSHGLLLVNAGALATTGLHVLAGLYAVRASKTYYLALLSAPGLALWKARLWFSTLRRGEADWVRTRRNSESTDPV